MSELQIQDAPRRPVVLCLDDDPETLGSLRRLLQKEPYEVVTTESPDEALSRLHRVAIDVVIVDERMPGISGTAFLKMVEFWSPETARLIVSGYPRSGDTERKDPELVQHFVPKPWNDDELRSLLRGLVKDRGAEKPAAAPPPPVPASAPLPKESVTARRPAGPDFMAEQAVLVECTGRNSGHVMSRLLPWLRRARSEGRDVVAVVEGLPLIKDNPNGFLGDLLLAVDVTGVRLHLLEGSGLAGEYFRSTDAFHPRIVIPSAPAAPRDLLLVDPMAPRRVFLKVLLSALGHRCRAVGSPADARRVLDSEPVDLMLLELTGAEDEAIDLVRDLARTGRGTGVVPLLGVRRAWSPLIAKKWNLQAPLLRPYRLSELGDSVR